MPKGKLNQSWNLILRACVSCNNRKSELEDDLSALTMQPDAWGRYAQKDPDLQREAARKGSKSVSRRTGKTVEQSSESIAIEGSLMPGVKVKFNLTGPPQAEPERAFELARLQLSGLFYWITFDSAQGKGGFWPEGFYPLQYTFRADWGNSLSRAFMREVSTWDGRLLVGTTEGFFKAMIKRHPVKACWAWALEWNHSWRLIGFWGGEAEAQNLVDSFPPLEHHELRGNEGGLRFREETPLAEEDDVLFSLKEG